MIQFNNKFNLMVRESLILVESEKCQKSAQKMSKIDTKRLFYRKLKVSIQYDSSILNILFKRLFKNLFFWKIQLKN